MRIGIIGAGAIGSVYAALLQRSGHEVSVVSRGLHRDTIAAHGIQLRGRLGEFTAAVAVVNQLGELDLCLICVKAHDTAEALSTHRAAIGTTPTVVIQNGVDGLVIAGQFLERSQLFGGIAMMAANFTEPGIVTVTNPQPTYIGRGHGPADAASCDIAAVLSDAVPTVAIDAFEGAMWTKLVFNMVNALPAITGLSVQQVARNRALASILAASMREAARIGIAAKIPFAKLPGLDETIVPSLARWPRWRTRRFLRTVADGMGAIPNQASMLQSIKRGRPTEIEFLNGAVVKTAETIGLDAPLNRAMTSIVHAVEASGVHLDVAELRHELTAHGAHW